MPDLAHVVDGLGVSGGRVEGGVEGEVEHGEVQLPQHHARRAEVLRVLAAATTSAPAPEASQTERVERGEAEEEDERGEEEEDEDATLILVQSSSGIFSPVS